MALAESRAVRHTMNGGLDTHTAVVRVRVCVTTYRRPDGLARLLHSLDRIELRDASAPELRLLIVDNDPARSAEPVCAALAPRLRWPLDYAWESRRGIPQARNHALRRARDSVDFIAFVDDDETVEPRWLEALLDAQRAFQADVVFGPVCSRFDHPVPAWVVRGGFFDRPRHATGQRVEHGGAGNCLLSTEVLRRSGLAFDERFALTGGEDTHLFLRMARLGHVLVWADDALVHEMVPPSRTRISWVLRRAFRVGSTWSVCEALVDRSATRRGLRMLKGVARIAQGSVLLLPSMLRGWPALGAAVRSICQGAGNLSGAAGVMIAEYRDTTGS